MITQETILIAQNRLAQGLIEIGKHKDNTENIVSLATKIISELYEYEEKKALFKPTRATEAPFRNSLEGAVSYFVGHNNMFPEDKGFALEPWVDISFKNHGFIFNEASAMAVGHYEFTSLRGHKIKAEYSFGYRTDSKGQLKITLHHSSLPYRS